MSHQHPHARGPVFAGPDGVGAPPPPAPPAAGGPADYNALGAQNTASTSANAGGTDLTSIFKDQMEQQKALYAQITVLNADKNRQSSYLSLGKGVSEKV